MSENLKIDPYGFREYDARWLYGKDINSAGIENLGKGLGTQIKAHNQKNNPRIIVGHDYRSYSEEIKTSLKKRIKVNRMSYRRYWSVIISYGLFCTNLI